MADEAEKLINLSLCKMAESRTIRRGGASLHKHLLISTVLTKARSAYFETWYMDGESAALGEENSRIVNMNSSYQEEEFPLDDDDDDDDFEDDQIINSAPNGQSRSYSVNGAESNNENMDPINCASDSENNNNMIDPRFFVEVESEIELPPDILNCVEKLGDLSEHMNFTADESASSLSVSRDLEDQTNRMVLSDVAAVEVSPEINNQDSSRNNSQLTYFDLDSRPSSKNISDCENNNNKNSDLDDFGSPLRSSTPNPSKRRRGWSLEEEDSDEDEGVSVDSILTSQQFSQELNEKLKRNGLSVTNVAKRLRFSPECEDSGMQSPSKVGDVSANVDSSRPLPVIIDSEFRTKKSHFDEDDQEDSEDDPFLGDGLGQSPFDGDNEQLENLSHRNDRRVPSASSSGSCSDEDGEAENCMEVDQITNLVQFISFGKHQSAVLHVTSSSMSSSSSVVTASAGSTTGLVRSMSSPDLCGLSSSSSSSTNTRVSVSSNSANNAKDLFSSYHVSNSNTSQQMSHRVLTTA